MPDLSTEALSLLPAPFHVITDAASDPATLFRYHAGHLLLHVEWHGHLTGDEVVEVARYALALLQQGTVPYQRALVDQRGTTGDWREAMPWLHFDWLPQIKAAGLRALGGVLSEDLTPHLTSHEFRQGAGRLLAIELFTNPANAWQWLLGR